MLFLCLLLRIFLGVLCADISSGTKVKDHNSLQAIPLPSLGQDAVDREEFKLTKMFDIQLKGRYDDLHPALQGVIQSQVQSDIEGNFQNHQSSNRWEKESVLETLKNAIESQSLPIPDFTSNCKYLVGVSKVSPFCDQLENAKNIYPKSCKEIQLSGHNVSGVYKIQPKMALKPFMVLCDMETKGGGWTHIQRRLDGSQDFFLGWREYKHGFGNLNGEFWMGLENIYVSSAFEATELLVEIVDRDEMTAHAHYKAFAIGPEVEGYPLKTLSNYTGDAGDALTHHLGSKFTTKDFDQDSNSVNCAVAYSGAWWYKSCHSSNLNGKYLNVNLPESYKAQGLHWNTFHSDYYCHSKARMLIRPA